MGLKFSRQAVGRKSILLRLTRDAAHRTFANPFEELTQLGEGIFACGPFWARISRR